MFHFDKQDYFLTSWTFFSALKSALKSYTNERMNVIVQLIWFNNVAILPEKDITESTYGTHI